MEIPISYLETLAQETHKTESELIALAFQSGLKQMWREALLGRYLRGELTRADAIDQVGIDWVELAERQYQAAREDIQWAMNA